MNGSSIWKEFDFSGNPLAVFGQFRDEPYPFLLESSLANRQGARYSFIGFDPFWVLRSSQKELFEDLRGKLNKFSLAPRPKLGPFLAGAVGFLSYDNGLNLPLAVFGFYDSAITIDHWLKKMYVFSSGFPEKGSLAKRRAEWRLRQILQRLKGFDRDTGDEAVVALTDLKLEGVEANFTKPQYLKAVKKALEYIRCGDIYQVNLSQRFSVAAQPDYLSIYGRLRRLSPAPFAALFNAGDFQIVSASPERFLQLKGRKVLTRPMKGTRQRGSAEKEDLALKNDLLDSPKDKAELLMIVDLLRNDLGRVCEYGSIKVSRMRELEAYATVFQTTATIEGELYQGKDRVDLLKAGFPGGSITGCPKIRAMEIIEELEPCRRGIYTGCLGYLSFSGDMDLNILIRTVLLKQGRAYFSAGGGIVSDSRPEKEYEETLIKARPLFLALAAPSLSEVHDYALCLHK